MLNYDALWGLVCAGLLVLAGAIYVKKRSKKEVQILNVEKEEEDGRDRGFRDRGRTGFSREFGDFDGEGGTLDYFESEFTDEAPITKPSRKMGNAIGTDSEDKQNSLYDSKTTTHPKLSDSDIPEIPDLD